MSQSPANPAPSYLLPPPLALTCPTHRAKNIEQASDASVDVTGSGLSAMLRSLHLAEVVGLAIRTCFSLTANGTLRETRCAGCMFQCKHSKRRKAREKEAMFFEETMSNYVPS